MNKKIFITGTSGIGKTTLAEYLSKRFMIPFINGSSKVLWDQYKINNHTELLQMGAKDPLKGLEFQLELLDIRFEAIRNLKEFVTDRTIVDNVVYFLYQNAPYLTEEQTADYIDTATNFMSGIMDTEYTDWTGMKLIYLSRDFLPWENIRDLEDDKARIPNKFYQDMMDKIFNHVLKKNLLKLKLEPHNYLYIRDYDWEARLELIESFLKRKPGLINRLFY